MKPITKSRANIKRSGENFTPGSASGEGGSPLTRQRRPTHPGAILREDVLPEIGLTQGQVAALLQVSRKTVNELLQERRGMTPDMAIRIARAFGSSPEMWLGLQQDYDLWVALQDKANAKIYRAIRRVA